MTQWDHESDVVIVGSGGAAFTAALSADANGAKPVILERTDKIGGTTAVSGGALWIPMNSHMPEVGITDSREDALAYCKKLTDGRADDVLVETFIDNGHKTVDFIEANTPVKFFAMTMPDYHPEEPGAKNGGRSIEPHLYDLNELGEWKDKVRSHAIPFMGVVTSEELWNTYKVLLNATKLPIDLMMDRMEKGLFVHGKALIGGMLKAALEKDIPFFLETRAMELIREGGRVVGVRAEKGGKDFLLKGTGGVILACGGFEWNEEMKKKYIPGLLTHPNSPPFNEGDGITMAAEIGADLANMHEVWWMPSTAVPGEEYENRQYSQLCIGERTAPHSILVNRSGKRFVNEACTYNEVVKPFFNVNENGTGFKNHPCWAISDTQFRANYTLMTVSPGDPDPEWLIKADTLEGLAAKIDVDPKGLQETVERFNGFVEQGKDLDFGRGDSAYDRFVGDKTTPHPVLGDIKTPPFYAVQIHPGCLGTKGGPRTNTNAQVLNVRGNVIPGLYAAGNVMAGISGPSYYGGGGTLGTGMTFGYLAGIHVANDAKSRK